jgi:thymidylate kinase
MSEGDVSSETVQENSEPVQEIVVKKKRVMSEAQKESLKLAREKAVLYRLQLKQEKEKMGIKDDKKLNKTQLKLLKLKELKEKREPSVVEEELPIKEVIKEVIPIKEVIKEDIPIKEVIPIKEPNIEVIPIKEPMKEPIKEPIKEVIKEVKEEVIPPKKIYKYVRDDNGFMFLM